MSTINIADLDKAEVLAALFNNSRQQGMGFMHSEGRASMTPAEAREILKTTVYFDYLRGRVMKIRIEDDLRVGLYDRDNGQGAAARAIDPLRRASTTSSAPNRSEPESAQAYTPDTSWPTRHFQSVKPARDAEPAFASGGGGDFGGGGASSSWDSGSSDSSSSSDSGSCSSSD